MPVLCAQTFAYEGPDFFDYPKKRAWAKESDILGWLDCSDDELAKRAQEWLYFGTLCEFAEIKYPYPYSTRPVRAEGLPLLSTVTSIDPLANSIFKETFRGTSAYLPKLSFLKDTIPLSELSEQQITSQGRNLPLFSYSIKILLQILRSFIFLQLEHASKDPSRTFPHGWSVSPAKATIHGVNAARWCPAQTYLLDKSTLAQLGISSRIFRKNKM